MVSEIIIEPWPKTVKVQTLRKGEQSLPKHGVLGGRCHNPHSKEVAICYGGSTANAFTKKGQWAKGSKSKIGPLDKDTPMGRHLIFALGFLRHGDPVSYISLKSSPKLKTPLQATVDS